MHKGGKKFEGEQILIEIEWLGTSLWSKFGIPA
jgi:hypothetical protein